MQYIIGPGTTKMMIILCFIAVTIAADRMRTTHEVVYCGEHLHVPKQCRENSHAELKCDSFDIQWINATKEMLTFMPQQMVKQVEARYYVVNKEPVACSSLHVPLEGVKLKYRDGRVDMCYIIAHGVIKGQPIIINLRMNVDPKGTHDLPEFVRQILEFARQD